MTRDEHLKKDVEKRFGKHEIVERSDRVFLLQQRHEDGGWDGNLWTEVFVGFHGAIYVGGDIGPVTFAYGPKDIRQRIAWIGGNNDVSYYVAQKASIGSRRGSGSRHFDENQARKDIHEMVASLFEGLDLEQDEVVEHLEDYVLRCDWPQDSCPDEPSNLRGYLKLIAEDMLQEGAGREALESFMKEHAGDNLELLESLKIFSEARKERHRKKLLEENPDGNSYIETLREALEIADSMDLGSADLLYDQLWRTREGSWLMEDVSDLGMVVSADVYYTWGAVRRLHHLLLEEENDERDRPAED
jgi:hypothetical protein